MRPLMACALVLVLGGCVSMQDQYNVRRSNLSCDEANRYAFRTMRSLGYTVSEFHPATAGGAGTLRGTKRGEREGTHSGTVHIDCRAGEVVLSAAEDEFFKQDLNFSRGFYLTFTSLADHSAEGAAWAETQSGGTASGGAKFKIQPQLGLESKLDFGEDLAAGGVLAVKVVVQNGSDRSYRLEPASIQLKPLKGSGKVEQLPMAQAAAAVARGTVVSGGEGAPAPDPGRIESMLRARALAARTLRPGEQAEGFVYFPTGEYASARATLVDLETDESEGFLVEF